MLHYDKYKVKNIINRIELTYITIKTLPQDRYPQYMKFVATNYNLLNQLITTGRIVPEEDIAEDSYTDISELPADIFIFESSMSEWITVEQTVSIDQLFSPSTRELMRRLAKYKNQKVSTQFLRLRKSKSISLTLLFGLCCSRPTYIFNAIFGVHATRIPTILPALS